MMKCIKLNDMAIRTTKLTHETLKQLKNFYECGNQETVIRHGLIALIDRSIMRLAQTEDTEKIQKLCDMRKKIVSKIY